MKNLCGKTRPKENPYEVWKAGGWTWNVLKKYQAPEKEAANPYARWFCFVTSPFCPSGEFGDVYVSEIVNNAVREVSPEFLEEVRKSTPEAEKAAWTSILRNEFGQEPLS